MNVSTVSIVTVIAFVVGCVAGFLYNQNRLEARYTAEKLALVESIREKEKALTDANEALQSKLKKEQANANKTIANLKRDVANGRVQYYANVRISDSSKLGFREERGELDRTLAQSLIDIASDGDQAIRELNYCIDAYNSLRK